MSEPAKRRFSVGRFVLWCLGGLVVLGIGLVGLDQARTSRRLNTAIDQLDETDSGWRLEDIEAARLPIPDPQNSAILCQKLASLLGTGWPNTAFGEPMDGVPLPELLDGARSKLLESEMVRLALVRQAAHPLADMPKGRHKIEYALHPLLTSSDEQQKLRQVFNLLSYEALHLSNKGDATGAVRCGRGCLCAARSIDDEPFLISQMVRMAGVAVGTQAVERALSLGESQEDELIALDKLLADEEKHETLLVGMRGERARAYQLFSRLGSGAIDPGGLFGGMDEGGASLLARISLFPRWQVRRQQPAMMDLMNRIVENARLPSHDQIAGDKEIEKDFDSKKSSYPIVAQMMPAVSKIGTMCRRKTANVAALRGLIAVERYRMKHGKWPTKLADVVPEFLKGLPTDPFDGTPMKMVRVAVGVIVYSVGYDGVDDGGKLDRKKPTAKGADLGFQLWDTEKRRRPASPLREQQP